MIILLIGFLGAGKSSIGHLLCEGTPMTCIEMDDYILAKTSYTSVNEAYDQNVAEWKEKELEASKELSQKDNIVLIGTAALVENKLNLTYFRENARSLKVIYLQTKPEILANRLTSLYDAFKKNGPRLVLQMMKKHYEKRDAQYREAADLIINTEESTPHEACQEILQKLDFPTQSMYA